MNGRTLSVTSAELSIVLTILARHLGGREVWAFGSRVKGCAKPFSDLDLAIVGDQPVALVTLADLADDFSESDLPFKVDLVDWATASEPFRRVIRQANLPLDQLQRPSLTRD
jgi:predicted nucleotidyltransferase